MDRDRWLGLGLVALGTATALVAHAADPRPGPPLYDGVILIEPYLWLDPPPGLPDGAEGVTESVGVSAGRNEVVVVETAEYPPQAQVFGVQGSMDLPLGATSIQVTITPIAAPAIPPPDGYIDGNVYRFTLTDQAGRIVTPKAHASVSVVLRPADQTLREATIERFDGAAWQPLGTTPDLVSAFVTIVTEFGDFAVVVPGVSPYQTPVASAVPTPGATPGPATSPAASNGASSGPSPSRDSSPPADTAAVPILVVAGLIAVAALAIAGLALLRRRRGRGIGPTGWSR